MPGKAVDITGKRFSRLVVLERAGSNKQRVSKWNCVCDCGNTKVVVSTDLKNGKTQSCGCLINELIIERNRLNKPGLKHGLSYHPLYYTWLGILQRTTNPNNKRFKDYGGRGIKICDTWKNDPEAFITWILDNLGDRPKGMSLDRVNNDGDYEPGNLRWATASEQNANRRPRTQITKLEMTNV
jgi:hypothetical protein